MNVLRCQKRIIDRGYSLLTSVTCPDVQDMYTEVPVPAALKDYKSFEFLRRDLRVSPPSGAGAARF